MEKLDFIWRIVEILIAAVSASILTRILTIKERVKQEKTETQKKEEDVKTDQIDNIKKIVDDVYTPAISNLRKMVEGLRADVNAVSAENETLKKEMAELKEENNRLKKENEELRDALREIRPDVVPSRRSINAQNQVRNEKGQFAAKSE